MISEQHKTLAETMHYILCPKTHEGGEAKKPPCAWVEEEEDRTVDRWEQPVHLTWILLTKDLYEALVQADKPISIIGNFLTFEASCNDKRIMKELCTLILHLYKED